MYRYDAPIDPDRPTAPVLADAGDDDAELTGREPKVVRIRDRRGLTRRLVLRLDPSSHIPPYEQLRAQLAVMVAVGQLEPGTRLPTVRELAAILGIAPGTVARTYRELEHGGLVHGLGRRGTFIADEPPNSEPMRERQRRLDQAATAFAFAVRQLGIRPDAALDAARAALDRPLPGASG